MKKVSVIWLFNGTPSTKRLEVQGYAELDPHTTFTGFDVLDARKACGGEL